MSVGLEDTQQATSEPLARPLVRAAYPATIGRFEIEAQIGEGGNGVVLLALDPTLGRKVAIKVLHRGREEDARQRLLREAQSIAQLAHDNIIVVHEVGTFDEQVYLAMEYVPGRTLTRWQVGRGWRECLDAYLRAGRGLAAAHAAGLVHRDFKPDNVLVGDDGRLRVTDFGLVRAIGAPAEPASMSPASSTSSALATPLTLTGTVMGTPRYMAPEQHLAEAVDARADQFAFCVALYEAMFGRAPFAGTTHGELSAQVVAGAVRMPANSPVPAWIRDAILRGLRPQRADRFPAMTELLAALAEPPRRRRWVLPVVGGGVVALAIVAVALVVGTRGAVLVPDAAIAAVVPDAAPETADEAFARAEADYNAGDFPEAIVAFKRGFELEPDLSKKGVNYLYNLGQAYRQLKNCGEAAFAFKRFLALKADFPAARRSDLEARIVELERCAEQQRPQAK